MAPYNFDTTAEEVATDSHAEIVGKTVLVTGVSPSSLGATFATIIALHDPASIILATSSLSKAEATAKEVLALNPRIRVWPIELDLGSLTQIRQAVEKIHALGEHIDVIVNNAGVMAAPYKKTVDGIETQFGVNHIGHFLLTNLLLSKALAAGKKLPKRIVNVTSGGYRYGPVRFEDWNFDDGNAYKRWVAYGQSKSANMLFTTSLAQKLNNQDVVAVSLHPGVIVTTGLGRHVAPEEFKELEELDHELGYKTFWQQRAKFKTPSQGVATHVYAAFHPALNDPKLNGAHLTDSQPVDPKTVQSWTRDPLEAEKLWELSETLVEQKFEY